MAASSGGTLQSYALRVRRPRPGVVVLAIHDELDGSAAPFRDCLDGLRHPGLRTLVIDLSATTFVASAGLHMLVDALPPDDDAGVGYDVHLAGVATGSTTMRLLEATDLDRAFGVFDGVDSCLASLDDRSRPA